MKLASHLVWRMFFEVDRARGFMAFRRNRATDLFVVWRAVVVVNAIKLSGKRAALFDVVFDEKVDDRAQVFRGQDEAWTEVFSDEETDSLEENPPSTSTAVLFMSLP
ncbi:hypothetical protein [Pseudomonas sp. Bc-h]|jgi:hypothetical protein|uniref:hypothetical protein n=1 Tax=Pseudomonas sp. Bc-h TaxID=1943632 RepID=UPI001E579DD9|nr:hypothetical protein [Pseudomonas sp. Bc-h]